MKLYLNLIQFNLFKSTHTLSDNDIVRLRTVWGLDEEAFAQHIRCILLAHSLTAWVVFISAIALLPLVWRGCEATACEQIYLLLLEPAANNNFSKQDAQILPYFVFTVFVHCFPKIIPKSQRLVTRVVAQSRSRSRKPKIQVIAWKSFRRRLAAVREGETVYLLRATQKHLKRERNQVVPWVWLKE